MSRNIGRMRAAFILALLLSLATPPGVWQKAPETAAGKGAAAAMSSPVGAICQLVRDFAKADKTFSGGWLPAIDRSAAIPAVLDFDHPLAHASLLHAVAIDSPPLSPRPPPM